MPDRRARGGRPVEVATIGYQETTMERFLGSLLEEGVELLVDVRAVASSRRPGFSKSRLREELAGVGIEYLHLRGLGTPADGRSAARAGKHEEMRAIFAEHLATPEAQAELDALVEILRSGKRVCLMCFEADPAHCHRRLLAERLQERMPLAVTDLRPALDE